MRLKKLQTLYALILLASMNLLSMEKENEFAQAKKFHERLQYAYHGILQDGIQSYYKKIDPITSTPPNDGIDQWSIHTVWIAEKEIDWNATGTYTHGDISFTIDPTADFNPTQSLNILVTHGEKHSDIQFTKSTEEKIPAFPHFRSYNAVLNAMHNHNLSLIHNVTLKGNVDIPEEKPFIILIEYENQREQPMTLQGMEIVCNKDTKKTNIFFDFTDQDNQPVGYFCIITCDHPVIADKEMCDFFDSAETRNQWVPNESNFYDQDNQVLTVLPKFYSNSNDHQERFNKPLTWMRDDIDIDNLLYQVPDEIWELIFLAKNKYSIIKPDMYPAEKAATQWCAMKNIVNISLVCKRFNAAAQKLLSSYTKEIKGYINVLGGKEEATYTAFTNLECGKYWFKVTEICKAMKADLNTTKHIEIRGNTLFTQAIRKKDTYQIQHLIKKGADPKIPNRNEDMPIDLAYKNGLLEAARLIKDNGGDPEDKYEYKNGNFVCKQGQGGQAYASQQVNGLDPANNNPPPIPLQTFSLASWLTRSPSYLFLAGISAGAAAYWLYTKYRAVDEDKEEEDDCLDANAESEEDCLNEATACTMSQ